MPIYGWLSLLVLAVLFLLVALFFEKKPLPLQKLTLLATLSALAGVGRVPFAAIPNVQPTTFLVIVSGYVFGPWLGFLTGALATLISNSFLGHGPWTVWQILAWGLCGFASGWLGRLKENPGRLSLSLFAFAWGFLFGAIMNIWHWLFFVYPLNFSTLLAVWAASFYFDLLHAVGNFIFAWFLGRDFIKIMRRFQAKTIYEMEDDSCVRKS